MKCKSLVFGREKKVETLKMHAVINMDDLGDLDGRCHVLYRDHDLLFDLSYDYLKCSLW